MTRPRFDAFFDSTVERGASVTPICLKPSTDRTANRRRRNHGRVIVPLAGPFSSPSRINDLANARAGLEPATHGLKERMLIGVLASSSIAK